jgi:hypothetical protein
MGVLKAELKGKNTILHRRIAFAWVDALPRRA